MRTADGERELLARLRRGDEAAFVELVERYHPQLIRLARVFVARPEVAEEVAQDTWLAMLSGLDRFEERSSLRTWLFQICVNRARSSGEREHRSVPVERIESAIDAEQFTSSGAWISPPTPWPEADTDPARDAVLVDSIRRAIDELPEMQRAIITMRDVDGLTSKQVCEVLSISAGNQRVLLHRARAHVRRVVDIAVIRR